MAFEYISESLCHLSPGPLDVHTHPRAFDTLTNDDFVEVNGGTEGKAGLAAYTEVALQSGITAILMMPNESLRRYDVHQRHGEFTELVPYPLSNNDRILATQSLISHEAVIPVGIHMGIDPAELFAEGDKDKEFLLVEVLHQRFSQIDDEVGGLKLYGDETEGGYNIHPKHIPNIVHIWNEYHPDKPVTLHLENENVGNVLRAIRTLSEGDQIPIHIAHVSSQQELEAVISAKEAGMNVTCEVTVHHLFLDGGVSDEIGGYGCVKPTLKTQKDIDFLWAKLQYIDIIASDCAPHRRSDKEAKPPKFGLTTHDVMLPLLFGAIDDDKLTTDALYKKLCVTPRARFNLPLADGTLLEYDLEPFDQPVSPYTTRYGYNPFQKLGRRFKMLGQVANAQAGVSTNEVPRTSYAHLIRPHNLGFRPLR